MRKLKLLLSLGLLTLVLGLAACGDSGGDEDKIIEVTETALTRFEPEDCTELMTQAFVEQMMRIEDPLAVEICEQNGEAIEHEGDPVEVSNVKVTGSRATVEIDRDGDWTDQTATVALVRQEGNWKLAEILRFPRLDRDTFLKETKKGFESGDTRPEPEVTNCVLETFAGMSHRELETMAYESSEREVEILKRCQQKGL